MSRNCTNVFPVSMCKYDIVPLYPTLLHNYVVNNTTNNSQ